MVIQRTKTYLQFYLDYFREATYRYVDLLPSEDSHAHSELGEKFTRPIDPNSCPSEAFDPYTHPCWCNPELIYVDELRGNQVWLHKRVQ